MSAPSRAVAEQLSKAQSGLVALLEAMPAARRADLSFRTRERARPGASAYRVQVAASLRGAAADATRQ